MYQSSNFPNTKLHVADTLRAIAVEDTSIRTDGKIMEETDLDKNIK